ILPCHAQSVQVAVNELHGSLFLAVVNQRGQFRQESDRLNTLGAVLAELDQVVCLHRLVLPLHRRKGLPSGPSYKPVVARYKRDRVLRLATRFQGALAGGSRLWKSYEIASPFIGSQKSNARSPWIFLPEERGGEQTPAGLPAGEAVRRLERVG